MKKFLSFCVAAAVAASAVPVMAQCASCGVSAPAFSQPVMNSYVPQATYSAPVMSQPVYSQPAYSAPVMSQPVYSAPVMSSQIVSSPAPVMSQPVYSAPMMSSPVVSSGCSGCCSGGCGGTVVSSGAVMGGQIISSGVVNSGYTGPGQIISWEGGTQIQGTIVSDVLVEGGEAAVVTESTESTEGANAVDVVEPPAAAAEEAAEESPGPDTDEESTEGET